MTWKVYQLGSAEYKKFEDEREEQLVVERTAASATFGDEAFIDSSSVKASKWDAMEVIRSDDTLESLVPGGIKRKPLGVVVGHYELDNVKATVFGAVGTGTGPVSSGSIANMDASKGVAASNTMQSLATADIRFAGPNDWSAKSDMNALAVSFGQSGAPQSVDPYSNYKQTHFQVPRNYLESSNTYSLNIIIHSVLFSKAWELTEMLKWQRVTGTKQHTWNYWHFDNHTTQRTSYESVSRLVTSRMESKTAGLLRWGISQRSEINFWRTVTGQLHWALQQIQMKNAVIETQRVNAMVAVLATPRADANPNRRVGIGYTAEETVQTLRDEINMVDGVKKYKNGLEDVLMKLRDRLALQAGRKTDAKGAQMTAVVPQKIIDFTVKSDWYSLASKTLIPGRHAIDSLEPSVLTGIVGVGRVLTSNSYITEQTGFFDVDLLQSVMTWGESRHVFGTHETAKNVRDVCHFRTDLCNYRSVFWSDTELHEMKYIKQWAANCLYDKKVLTREVGQLFFANYAKCAEMADTKRGEFAAAPSGTSGGSSSAAAAGARGTDVDPRVVRMERLNKEFKALASKPAKYTLTEDQKAFIREYCAPAALHPSGPGAGSRAGVCHTAHSFYTSTKDHFPMKYWDLVCAAFWARASHSLDFRMSFIRNVWLHSAFDLNTGAARAGPGDAAGLAALQTEIFGKPPLTMNTPSADAEAAAADFKAKFTAAAAYISLFNEHYFQFVMANDIPTYLSHHHFTPSNQSTFCDILVAHFGDKLGQTLVGDGTYLISQDITGVVSAALTFTSAAVVESPELAVTGKGAMMTGIRSGCGGPVFWEYADREKYRKKIKGSAGSRAMFCVVLPLGEDSDYPCPLADFSGSYGNWSALGHGQKGGLVASGSERLADLLYATAPLYASAEMWEKKPQNGLYGTRNGSYYRNETPEDNTICPQQFQLFPNKTGDYTEFIEGSTVLGSNIQPGDKMREYIKGNSSDLPTPFYKVAGSGYRPKA